MARLWSTGFELQSATALVEWDSNSSGGGPTGISTSVKRSGEASLQLNPSNSQQGIFHNVGGSGTELLCRFYLRIASAPSASNCAIAAISSSGGGAAIIYLNTNRTLSLYGWHTSSFTSRGTSSALDLDTWYRVEFRWSAPSATWTYEALLDGVQFGTGSSNTGVSSQNPIRLDLICYTSSPTTGSVGNVSADLYFDDVAVNDASGTVQNSWPGEGRIVHLKPNAAGDNNAWRQGSGTTSDSNNYTFVDEVTPDDATTYLRRNTTGTHIDDYNIENPTDVGIGSGDTITLVQIGGRIGATSNTSTNRAGVYRIKGQAAGTVQESANIDWSINGWRTLSDPTPRNYKLTAYVNPQDDAAWTPASLANAQIGFRNATSSSNEIRVSTLWALVEYVEGDEPPVSNVAIARRRLLMTH